MKEHIILAIFAILQQISYAQNGIILPNTGQGEKIFSPNVLNSTALINVNTGTPTLGADYYFVPRHTDPARYVIMRFGITGKATEGIAALVSKGQFSPGIKASASLTKVGLLVPKSGLSKFSDWLTFNLSYNVDKYKLFNKDTLFKNQVIDTTFRGLNLGADYTLVLNKAGTDYLNFRLGYERRNNFQKLTSIEVDDTRSLSDSASNTTRISRKTVTAREGRFLEFDACNFGISYTRLPPFQRKTLRDPHGNEIKVSKTTIDTQYVDRRNVEIKSNGDSVVTTTKEVLIKKSTKYETVENPNYKFLQLGYTFYYNGLATPQDKPESNLGLLLFLFSPNKDDVLVPRLGLDLQFKDITDIQRTKTGLMRRFAVALTTSISL